MTIRSGRNARSTTGALSAADHSRRQFVMGAGAVGLLGSVGARSWATDRSRSAAHLSGSDFALTIGHTAVNITGRERRAVTVNGSLPAPVLHWQEGDTVTLRVTNELPEPTSIHWHGILLPSGMDGVPGLSFPGIAPGETFTYQFPVRQSGTYWYHSHSGFQEQLGLYGALVIHPREPDGATFDQDYVVLLSDWTDENPARVLAKLKKQADYYNFNQPTVGDLISEVRRLGWRAAVAERAMWGEMRMNRTDLADVSGYTYTYLINGQGPEENWTGLFRPGERIRLRFINGSGMTYFDVRIPGLKMTVIAADGQPVNPVNVDEFRIAVAETFDVLVTPEGEESYTIFAQSMDRTGFARGTLATRSGLNAPVPALDAPVALTMADMGHDMAGHDMAAMPTADAHAGRDMNAAPAAAADPHAGHDMAGMADMPGMATTESATPSVRHAPTEFGPAVDMRAMSPVARLGDPGIGLRDNGRRVLTYADLRSAFPDPDGREPTSTIELHLTGHMERYIWSFDGVRSSDAAPVRLKYGERVRFVLVNDGMMSHPIHLHGMWSDLEDEQGRFLVRKHTISVKPGERVTYRVSADALGRWAYHCHLLMHMESGMFREVRVDE
ncbi:MAG: copper resistance system multicopper oxidase [Chromatiales bacterium]|nr:copper resistance system multicopper oxidase [Chromatiales bacterium]